MVLPISIEKTRELIAELEAVLANLDKAQEAIPACHVSLAIELLRQSAGMSERTPPAARTKKGGRGMRA